MKHQILVRERPNRNEMDLIESVKGLMLSFMYQPDSVTDISTSKAFLDGWLAGLDLTPNHRLALIIVPKSIKDLENFKEQYIKNLEEMGDSIKSFNKQFASIRGTIGR